MGLGVCTPSSNVSQVSVDSLLGGLEAVPGGGLRLVVDLPQHRPDAWAATSSFLGWPVGHG